MNDYIKGFDSLSETGLMSTDGIEWPDELRKEMESLHKFVSKML